MSILWALILMPATAGTVSFFIRSDRVSRTVWIVTALSHFALSVTVILSDIRPLGTWIGIDSLAMLFLPLTSLLFLGITFYGTGYIAQSSVHPDYDPDPDFQFWSVPRAVFTGCMLLFLSSMCLAILSRHFGLQWVAIEATTLTSTPLIYFHRHRRSLEAAWKYLLICSTAIALALLGVFFIGLSTPAGYESLSIDILIRNASHINTKWLEMAFILLLVGYGTKMGLAPLHTWLPDAHSEAPSPVSALLSGALLNCAFIGILRLQQVCVAAGIGSSGQTLLIVFGLFSMGMAGVFILRQPDYKRLLAYSSVEHMGILAAGIGIGGTAVFGALLHAVNHSLVKSMLFMTAGNILSATNTKRVENVSGLCRMLPVSGIMWFAGFLAIAGSPPFGTFISEFTITKSALDQGSWITAAAFLTFLSVVFIGLAGPFIHMCFGKPSHSVEKESWLSIAPALIFLILSLFLGMYIPARMTDILTEAARCLGGAGL